ncbi:MAG: DNA-formamidopyrimidine glycosylase family protein [Lapillicoccus sp.]
MPEGHTLHRLAQALDGAFAGMTPSVASPQGRFEDGAALLDGREVVGASAWGKHLFVEFEGDQWLNVHLGLIGKFSVEGYDLEDGVPPVRGQVRLRLLTTDHVADLRGAIVVQVVTPAQVDAIIARLGPDPLRTEQDPDIAWKRIAKSGRSFAELLMDQSILAGVGNVYRCEVLFRHRIDPFRPGKEVRPATWRAVWADLVRLMPLGVAFNQILTMEDQVEEAERLVAEGHVPHLSAVHTDSARRATSGPAGVLAAAVGGVGPAADLADETEDDEDDGGAGTSGGAGFARRYYVYRRQGQPCRVCGSKIRTRIVAGRNLFWCGRCQRRR